MFQKIKDIMDSINESLCSPVTGLSKMFWMLIIVGIPVVSGLYFINEYLPSFLNLYDPVYIADKIGNK